MVCMQIKNDHFGLCVGDFEVIGDLYWNVLIEASKSQSLKLKFHFTISEISLFRDRLVITV